MKDNTVHAVFDIGKTNKKLFLFDNLGNIVWKTNTTFPTTEDEDGFVTDDLKAIESWMVNSIMNLLENGYIDSTQQHKWSVKTINFSGYGASLVYLDEKGERLPMFINYLKPFPEELERSFIEKYGPKIKFCRDTASPWLGMLNSGLQIYWLKYAKPQWFAKVKYILHFPQYLSYLFSGTALAEYTSIGCHTGMWDFQKQDYHQWIDKENLRKILPPIYPSNSWMETACLGQTVRVGTGLHDTSASLIPYLTSEKELFILLSTGTWALAVNPFSQDELSINDLENDCLNFLRIKGKQVRTTRLFLGREHEIQVGRLSEFYEVEKHVILNLIWETERYEQAINSNYYPFELVHLKPLPRSAVTAKVDSAIPLKWSIAYYQLMNHLVSLQIEAIHRATGSQDIHRLIIEGGFVHNNIFVELLRQGLPDWEVRTSDIQGGSARGVFELVPQDE